MVDYILKIDIDESDLVRKLNSALKKANMYSGGGSGSTGGGKVGGMGTPESSGERGYLTEAGMKRITEYEAKQQSFREGQANTLLLDNELKMGRKADAHGKTMERIGAVQNNWTKKMFNIGTVVKLAGLATGVAGLLQMRKMVIDSSPMLQAMLKLLNVGIMFILRPIGDFFGFVLRPLLVPFILLASQFYASRLGLISETGTDAGQALLEGDVATLIDRLLLLPKILLGDPEQTKEDLEARKKAEEEGNTFWDDILNVMTLVNPQLNIFKLQIASWASLFSKTTVPNPVEATGGAFGTGEIAPCGAQYEGPGGGPSTHACTDFSGSGTTAPQSTGKDYKIKLSESIGLSDSPLTTEVVRINENLTQMENWMEIEKLLAELALSEEQRQTELIATEFAELIATTKEGSVVITDAVAELLRSNETSDSFASGGLVGEDAVMSIEKAKEEINLLQESIEAKGKELEGMHKSSRNYKTLNTQLAYMNDRYYQLVTAVNMTTGEFEDLQNRLSNLRIGVGGDATAPTTSDGGGGGLTPIQQYSLSSKGSYTNDCGETITAAGGGVISEEIYGIGKCSGKKYRFGEEGDEAIIPMNDFNSLVGGMGRIGIGSMIGQKNVTGGAVGKFSGISASRYSRFTSDVYNAKQGVAGAQGALCEYNANEYEGQKTYQKQGGVHYCGQQFIRCPSVTTNTKGYDSWLSGQSELQGQLTTAQAGLTSSQDKLDPYAGAYSESQTISALEGQRQFEGGGSKTTNLGGITINVSGATNVDGIVDQIGPKLLKYLQDNDSRVGIR